MNRSHQLKLQPKLLLHPQLPPKLLLHLQPHLLSVFWLAPACAGALEQLIAVLTASFRQVGAMNFAFCIMGALMARERHGVGQKVETSQLGAMIQFQSADILAPWHTGEQRDDGLPARVNDVVLVSEGRLQAALARVPYD